ncbi:hypothetical protein BQ8794_210112 [Mesorhizobium prunaredense]|uniref:Uncharacterized protein n=1 Tax=Mesorhizobium prunaredense TaxID=1631249 RepID=A0A1R3V850_9HYPH|nr:hypothetical protein BQ8794_210112 [Mesorhizobium prunaredense]
MGLHKATPTPCLPMKPGDMRTIVFGGLGETYIDTIIAARDAAKKKGG